MAAPIGPGDFRFDEFSPFIACDPNSGCWLWFKSLTRGGYGKTKIGGRGGREVYAHRLSYEAHHGPLCAGEVVCHKCDTPACVNPAHLFAGSQSDNMRDAWAKGRLNDPNRDRSTPEAMVAEIKAALAAGFPGRVVAADYGISAATVSAIKNGHRWAHIRPKADLIESLKAPPQSAPVREREDA